MEAVQGMIEGALQRAPCGPCRNGGSEVETGSRSHPHCFFQDF